MAFLGLMVYSPPDICNMLHAACEHCHERQAYRNRSRDGLVFCPDLHALPSDYDELPGITLITGSLELITAVPFVCLIGCPTSLTIIFNNQKIVEGEYNVGLNPLIVNYFHFQESSTHIPQQLKW